MAPPTKEQIAQALRPLLECVRTDATWVKTPTTPLFKRREPLNHDRLLHHLNGGPVRGVGLMRPGEDVTRIAVIDLDSHKGETSWGEMTCVAAHLCDVLEMVWGCSPMAFRSGGGHGVHIYLLWEEPQHTYSVRQMLFEALAMCGLRHSSSGGGVAQGQAEVFPKQDSLTKSGDGSCGSQVFLPMGGASEPLEYEDLSGAMVLAGRGAILAPGWWRMSAPVTVREKPVRPVVEIGPIDEDKVRVLLDALGAIAQASLDGRLSLGRNEWRDVVFGIHSATGGSEQGFAIALDFSEGADGWDDASEGLLRTIWDSADARREGGIGEASVRHLARSVGWVDPTLAPMLEEFPVVPVADRRFERDGNSHNGPSDELDLAGAAGGEVTPGLDEEGAELPPFDRERNGTIKPTMDNAVMAMRRPDLVGVRIGHDEFRDEITLARPRTNEWQPMTDAALVRLRIRLEKLGFKSAPKDLARDAVVLVAAERSYDSARLWLDGLKWDGVPRVERFLSTYMGTDDTPYTRAVSRYLWTALAGRVLFPGVKADMVPIYEGDQGIRKSTAIEALAPAPEFFVEIDLAEKEENTVRKLRGSLVGEIAELSGLNTRAIEDIKRFVVRKTERWVPKYKEFTTTFHRRLVFIGTTNKTEILADETGNRRWLPVHIEKADVAAIVRDRAQLWAEGAVLFGDAGVAWQDAEGLAPVQHLEYMVSDPWEDAIRGWLSLDEVAGGAPFSTSDVLAGALNMRLQDMNRAAQMRVAAVLKCAGYERRTARDKGKTWKGWVLVKK